jgi:ubiquinone/menaquinone biosynthesis C-methylase UbiE
MPDESLKMRLQALAFGRITIDEMLLMLTEKIEAMEQAKRVVLRGGDPSLVIENYQKIVTANVARLSAS